MTTKTLTGPGGLKLVLDSSQIFPDDPGQGTPAMVELGKDCGTYYCAVNEGELSYNMTQLTAEQVNWLEQQDHEVEAFMLAHGG